MTPDHLGLKEQMGIKAPPRYCNLFSVWCSLQSYSGSIHADIRNRQDGDHNSHFPLQLNRCTYKYYYHYYGWVTVNGKWGRICHSQSPCEQDCLVRDNTSLTNGYNYLSVPAHASGITPMTLCSRRRASSSAEPMLVKISTQKQEVIQCKAKTNVTAIWTGTGARSWEIPKEHFVLTKCFGTWETSPGCWTLSMFR